MRQTVIYAKDILCHLLEGDDRTLEFVAGHAAAGDEQVLVPAAFTWALRRAQPTEEGVKATADLLWRAELSPIRPERPGRRAALLTSDFIWHVVHGADLSLLRGMAEEVDLLVNTRSVSLTLFACREVAGLALANLGEGFEEMLHFVDEPLPPVDAVEQDYPSEGDILAVIERATQSTGGSL